MNKARLVRRLVRISVRPWRASRLTNKAVRNAVEFLGSL
jgi:hypothetical protein